MQYQKLRLKPGKERVVAVNRHPWVFSGAFLSEGHSQVAAGDIVDLYDSSGRNFLARGYCNTASQIMVRILTWDCQEKINADFWKKRISGAIERRRNFEELSRRNITNAYRVISAEADLMPGLIVDRYDGFIVVQSTTAGIDKWIKEISEVLGETLKPKDGIYERSDDESRKFETASAIRVGVISGKAPPEDGIEIVENGMRFIVDIVKGHKSGFYLDQRDNRKIISELSGGKSVLNCFCYTGGFGVAAALGGAKTILNIDVSEPALQLAKKNVSLNSVSGQEFLKGDVFDDLRNFEQAGRKFDLIILDPPKFAFKKSQLESACRGYKDINLLALRLLNPHGYLATFSCSGLVSANLFQKIVFGASVDAKVDAQIVRYLGQAADHPVLLSFPESQYLKGLLLMGMTL